MSAAVGISSEAMSAWGSSSRYVAGLSPDMTIKEAARILGVSTADVAVVSSRYVQRLHDHWQEASDLVEDAKTDLEKMKAIHEFYQASIRGKSK